MKRIFFGATVVTTALVLVLPFVGGGGPGLTTPAIADSVAESPALASISSSTEVSSAPIVAAAYASRIDTAALDAAAKAAGSQDSEHLAQKPVPKPQPPVDAAGAASGTNDRRSSLSSRGLSCPGYGGSSNSGAPGITSPGGVGGTTSDDLASFAAEYNAIRADNCLDPVSYFVYDSCMEQRLFWMAEDPSEDPLSAWGHLGSQRSDGVPSVGCDGNLAGGYGNGGSDVASKWWYSPAHQASLYRPGDSTGGVCIAFAMTHGGVPDEPYEFTRAAARWIYC
ncbi:MAG: hypothetical protein ABJA94_06990 [Rhodoglobus sp.]